MTGSFRGNGQSDQRKDRRRGVVLAGGDPERGVDRRASGPGVTATVDRDQLGAAGVRGDRNVRGNPGGDGRPAAVEDSPGRYGRGGGRGRKETGRPWFPTVGIHWVGVAMDGDDPEPVAAHPRVDRRRYRDHRLDPARHGAGGEDGHVTTVAYPGDHDAGRIGAFGGSQLRNQCGQERHIAITGGTGEVPGFGGACTLWQHGKHAVRHGAGRDPALRG